MLKSLINNKKELEVDEILGLFLQDETNLQLYQNIKTFFKTDDRKKILTYLAIVEDNVKYIYLFQDKPFKIIKWIKSYVSFMRADIQNFFIKAIIQLADRHIENKENSYNHIKSELLAIDKLNNNTENNITIYPEYWMSFFTDNKGISGKDAVEKMYKGYLILFSFIFESKEDNVKKFIINNKKTIATISQTDIEFKRLIKSVIKTAETYPNLKAIKESHINKFVNILIEGIKELLSRGNKESCINNLKGEKNESEWRDWFSEYFQREEDYIVLAEPEQGKNKIDLLVSNKNDKKEYKIELKLWYNQDKENIINQIHKYLTDFDKYGFIIMINDTKTKDIRSKYEKIVKNEKTKYKENSWLQIRYNDYEFLYKSVHKKGIEKEIFHFIINPFLS